MSISLNKVNRKEAARKKSLGELGELFAIKALVDNNFDKIRNLNDDHLNETFADLKCERDGKAYIISVKARNKFQKNGKLNARYNLGTNAYQKAKDAELKHNATAYWMAIYFGSLSELIGAKAIPVDKCEKGLTGSIWVNKKRHYFDFDFYSNGLNDNY